MNHRVFRFQNALGDPRGAAAGDGVVTLPNLRPDDEVRYARFIFQCYKRNASRRAWTLTQEHDPGHANAAAVNNGFQFNRAQDALLLQLLPEEGHWMRLQ